VDETGHEEEPSGEPAGSVPHSVGDPATLLPRTSAASTTPRGDGGPRRNRRRLWLGSAAAVAVAAGAAVWFFLGGGSGDAKSIGAMPSTFCAASQQLVGLDSQQPPGDIQNAERSYRRVTELLRALRRTAPRAITGDVQILASTLANTHARLQSRAADGAAPSNTKDSSAATEAAFEKVTTYFFDHCKSSPALARARQAAQDGAAQSNLRDGLTAAKTIFTDNDSYADVTPAKLQDVEPSLTYVTGPVTADAKTVSVHVIDANNIVLAAASQSGTCFFIRDDARTATQYASSPKATPCDAASPPTNWGPAWSGSTGSGDSQPEATANPDTGDTQPGGDRPTQSNLRNALTAAKTIFTDNDSYAAVTPASLQQVEPSLAYRTGPVTAAGGTTVSINTIGAGSVVLAAASPSGKCFFLRDDVHTGTQYASSSEAQCNAASPPNNWGPSW